jgi:MFS family permease
MSLSHADSAVQTRLPWATYILSLAQAINLTAAVISVTIAALIGMKLASTPALGTVPYGMQFAAVLACTYPASIAMRRFGRRAVFRLGAVFMMAAGLLGYIAVSQSSFLLFAAAHALLGVYIACANFYRFAAVDHLSGPMKARGISLVVAGGVLAAVAGPTIAESFRIVPDHTEFAVCYVAISVLGVLNLLLLQFWRPPKAHLPTVGSATVTGSLKITEGGTVVAAAILASAGGYFVMNLLMVQASLVMRDICSFDAASGAIQAHVLAMFAPSFATGALIARVGLRQVLILGFILLAASAIVGTMLSSYEAMFIGLVLLGLGWNFTYVGGGALLAERVRDGVRHRWQGINDTLIAACATLGAFLPAPLLAWLGWAGSNMLTIPLCMGGAALCWYALRSATTPGEAVRAASR